MNVTVTQLLLQSNLPTTVYITFFAGQFKQVWYWDVDQMLYFTLKRYKSAKASGAPPRTIGGGTPSTPANSLAGIRPILCLIVFFIGPNCMRISLSPHF